MDEPFGVGGAGGSLNNITIVATRLNVQAVTAGAGVGIGNIFAALVSSIARNPAARDQVFGIGMLGFALTEAVALYALLIAFLVLYAV